MVTITVTIHDGTDPATGKPPWGVPWFDPEAAAKACKAAGVTATAGHGRVYLVSGTTDKSIIRWVVKDVARRLRFMA